MKWNKLYGGRLHPLYYSTVWYMHGDKAQVRKLAGETMNICCYSICQTKVSREGALEV